MSNRIYWCVIFSWKFFLLLQYGKFQGKNELCTYLYDDSDRTAAAFITYLHTSHGEIGWSVNMQIFPYT